MTCDLTALNSNGAEFDDFIIDPADEPSVEERGHLTVHVDVALDGPEEAVVVVRAPHFIQH